MNISKILKKINEIKQTNVINLFLSVLAVVIVLSSCSKKNEPSTIVETSEVIEQTKETEKETESTNVLESSGVSESTESVEEPIESKGQESSGIIIKKIKLNPKYQYATYSAITKGEATLYKQNKGKPTVTVNAGHGTKNGSKYKTYSHPDFTPKYSGGSNKLGAVKSYAISEGMVFTNGLKEADLNLAVAMKLKDKLLADGYSVLMIRESDDVQLDNIARTVIANENSDIHIAIHFDSTSSDKGIFYVVPIKNDAYLNMEPLKYNVDEIKKLGSSIIDAFKELGEKIWNKTGMLGEDLTQLSYSKIPSVDIELGDKATPLDDARLETFALGIKNGIDKYFENKK